MLPNVEIIYQLTLHKKWPELLDIVHKNSKAVAADEQVAHAIKTFEDEFFLYLKESGGNLADESLLEKLYLLHVGLKYQLPEEHFTMLVVELARINLNKDDLEAAYRYALRHPKNATCAEIIRKYEDSLPKEIPHTQSLHIKVTENKDITAVDLTTSLFKSEQEHEFFMAVRNWFRMFTVYPNVALRSVIDFDAVRPHLSQQERDFFFTGLIDCVVFDHHDEYKPKHFFELDSPWHDTLEQKRRDKQKDRILSLAGQKLYRIRSKSPTQGQEEFSKLIRDILTV